LAVDSLLLCPHFTALCLAFQQLFRAGRVADRGIGAEQGWSNRPHL